MSTRIYCIAEFAPKEGCEQELFEKLMALEPLALREDGCLRYRVTRQIPHPEANGASRFSIMFNEEWVNIDAFNAHFREPYLGEFFRKYVENPETAIVADSNVRIFSDNL